MTNENVLTMAQTPLIKHGWLRATLFIICALIVTAIFSSVGITLIALIHGIDLSSLATNARDLIRDLGISANIVISLAGFLGMLLTAFLFRRFIDRNTFKSLGFSFSGFQQDVFFGLILGIGLISVGFFLLTLTDVIIVQEYSFDVALLFGYIIFFLIGSLNEEIMIRGYFLNNLMDSWNKYFALFASSLLFALLHLANAHVTFLSFINIFLAGILLGIYYVHRRNLWLPVALHFSWNFFQGPVFGFEVSGVNIQGIIIQELKGNDLLTGGDFGFEGSVMATVLMLGAIALLHNRYAPELELSDKAQED